MPPSCASDSTIRTPGNVGRPGKWPEKKGSSPVSAHWPRAETPGSTSVTSETNRNGGRCGRTSAGSGSCISGGYPQSSRLRLAGLLGCGPLGGGLLGGGLLGRLLGPDLIGHDFFGRWLLGRGLLRRPGLLRRCGPLRCRLLRRGLLGCRRFRRRLVGGRSCLLRCLLRRRWGGRLDLLRSSGSSSWFLHGGRLDGAYGLGARAAAPLCGTSLRQR